MNRIYRLLLEKLTLFVWIHGKRKVFEKYWLDEGRNRLAIQEFILKSEPKSVFEFGMFVGRNLKYLSHLQLSGCDINGKAIQFARSNLPGDFFTISGLEQLNTLDVTYDTVVCVGVFYAINERELKKILYRLKKMGNELIIGCNFEKQYNRRFYKHDYEKIFYESNLVVAEIEEVPEKGPALTHLVRLKIK